MEGREEIVGGGSSGREGGDSGRGGSSGREGGDSGRGGVVEGREEIVGGKEGIV